MWQDMAGAWRKYHAFMEDFGLKDFDPLIVFGFLGALSLVILTT